MKQVLKIQVTSINFIWIEGMGILSKSYLSSFHDLVVGIMTNYDVIVSVFSDGFS